VRIKGENAGLQPTRVRLFTGTGEHPPVATMDTIEIPDRYQSSNAFGARLRSLLLMKIGVFRSRRAHAQAGYYKLLPNARTLM
jgi:hypothetical protein